jgi:hypothetical protein
VDLGHAVKYDAFAPSGATAIVMPSGAENWETNSPEGYFFKGGLMGDKEMARLIDEMVMALNESYVFDGNNRMMVKRDLSSFDIVKSELR